MKEIKTYRLCEFIDGLAALNVFVFSCISSTRRMSFSHLLLSHHHILVFAFLAAEDLNSLPFLCLLGSTKFVVVIISQWHLDMLFLNAWLLRHLCGFFNDSVLSLRMLVLDMEALCLHTHVVVILFDWDVALLKLWPTCKCMVAILVVKSIWGVGPWSRLAPVVVFEVLAQSCLALVANWNRLRMVSSCSIVEDCSEWVLLGLS